MKSSTICGFIALVFLISGCFNERTNKENNINNTKKSDIVKKEPPKERFYNIDMLGKIDTEKFQVATDNNESLSFRKYLFAQKDDLFDTVNAITNKQDIVLKIELNKDVGTFGDPYEFANKIVGSMVSKYGSFQCLANNMEFFGKVGENCTNIYKDNVIKLNVFHFGSTRSVRVQYINKEFAKYDRIFQDELNSFQAKSKL